MLAALCRWWRMKTHRHVWREWYYDLRADEPGGPKTYHGIGWTCRICAKTIDGGSRP